MNSLRFQKGANLIAFAPFRKINAAATSNQSKKKNMEHFCFFHKWRQSAEVQSNTTWKILICVMTSRAVSITHKVRFWNFEHVQLFFFIRARCVGYHFDNFENFYHCFLIILAVLPSRISHVKQKKRNT